MLLNSKGPECLCFVTVYNLNFYKTEYRELLPFVNLQDFCYKKIVACDFDLLGYFS